jgi:uncharacterized protein (UPF0276 family)
VKGEKLGVVYNSGLDDWLRRSEVGVVEVEPQTLWFYSRGSPEPYRVAEEELERVSGLPGTKLIHGIGFAVGGSIPPERTQLAPLRRTIEVLRPAWVSEHLAFNAFDDGDGAQLTGFMLPPRQTPEGVRAAVRSIRSLADELDLPFAVETGVSYLQPRGDEMPDGAFVAEIIEAADCGLVLDLHNLWTNERNGRQPAREFIAQLPLERVWEIHLAGGEERHGYWLDGHCDGVPEPVLELLREVVPRLPKLGALVFELFPTHLQRLGPAWIGDQLATIRAALDDPRPAELPSPPSWQAPSGGPDPTTWEQALGRVVLGFDPRDELERELHSDGGVALVQELLQEFRSSMFASAMPLSCRLLLLTLGPARVTELLTRFAHRRSPERFASSEAMAFVAWLADQQLEIPYLSDILAYERAVIEAATTARPAVARLTHDPLVLCRALANGRLPQSPRPGNYEVELTP